MNNVGIRAVLRRTAEGVLIIPASNADKTVFMSYVEQAADKYVSLDFKNLRATKTYDQLKAAWALIDLIFQSMYFRRPISAERQQMYAELLEEFAPRKPSLLHQGQDEPKTFSEMSKQELSSFIQSLISFLAESCDLNQKDQMMVKDIFLEWQSYKSSMDKDPDDYDENGELLDMATWRERHTVSFASGIGGDLDLAHIVSRGADTVHRDCCWNVMLLTHEEHMMQHAKGWNEFLKIYPHLRGRVERARHIAGKLALLEAD